MPEDRPTPEEEARPGDSPSRPRGRPLLSWVIVLAVTLTSGLQWQAAGRRDSDLHAAAEFLAGVRWHYGGGGEDPGGPPPDREAIWEAVAGLPAGPVTVRHRLAVVAGDLRGPLEARRVLEEMERLLRERGRSFRGADAQVHGILQRLYAGDAERHGEEALARLRPEERTVLLGRLDWFGRLALAPGGPATADDRSTLVEDARARATLLASLDGGFPILFLGGLGCLLAGAILMAKRRLAPLPSGPGPPDVHAEAAAVFVLVEGLPLILPGRPPWTLLPGEAWALWTLVAVWAAVSWPVLRGVARNRVLEEVGLRGPEKPVREILAGAAVWLASFPIFTLGGTIQGLLEEGTPPQDPFQAPQTGLHPQTLEVFYGAPLWMTLVLSSLLAPLLEETLFRGFLYRHLRDLGRSRGWPRGWWIPALAVSLMFGAVHPQGPGTIPALAVTGMLLAFAREWRGCLLAPMVCHALLNASIAPFDHANYGP